MQGNIVTDSVVVEHPYHVHFKDLVYFMVAPTLCYQVNALEMLLQHMNLEYGILSFIHNIYSHVYFIGFRISQLLRTSRFIKRLLIQFEQK